MSKRLEYFKIIDREQGIINRESGTGSLFLILVCNTNIPKVQIGNKEPVPGSFLIIILFILVSGFVYFIGNRESGTAKGKLVPYFGILD